MSAGGPGGLLYTEYTNAAAGERHGLRLHVAPFDPTPVPPDNDYLYTGFGPHAPLESGLLATFAALAALWQDYFPSSWQLALIDCWLNDNGVLTRLDVVPNVAPVVGVATEAVPHGVVLKRVFHVRSRSGSRRRIYLSQVPGGHEGRVYSVDATSGGIDGRDQAVMAYLSGAGTGVRSYAGDPFMAQADVRTMWSRRLAPPPGGGGGGADRDTFYGPTAPDAPPDAALWADTSSGLGTPWPLRVWNAAGGVWEITGEQDQFMQAVAPTANEHGDLWVDQSSGPPYPLRAWNAGSGAWEDVGPLPSSGDGATHLPTTCLVFPDGDSVCGPSGGVIQLNVGGATQQVDRSGYQFPNGWRWEEYIGAP